jgi:hypothetical protein
MFAVLTAASVVLCPHQAPLTITPSQHLMTVDGQPVLVRADLLAGSVPTCPNVGPGLKKCLAVVSVLGGLSATLRIGGEPVVLENAHGLTDGVPGPVEWRVQSAGQTKLETS